MVAFKTLSSSKLEEEGVGTFSQSSTLRTAQFGATEIVKNVPFENLSKFTPKLILLADLSLLAEVSLQFDGGYVSRASSFRFDAIGQGETEEEAIEDLRSAVKLLKEVTSTNE